MRIRKRALSDLAIVIAFAAICIGGLGYLAIGMGLPVPFVQQGWTLKARFPHAEGLVPQSDVYESGVHVGKVLSVQADGSQGAIVTMRIDSGVSLHQDVRAYVEPKTSIGDTYVDLVRNPYSTAPVTRSGYEIPPARTGQSVQVDTILNTLNPATRAAMSESLQQLGVAVSGQSGAIHSAIPQVNDVLANLRPIVQVSDVRQHDLNQILGDLAVIMRSLAQEQQSLGQLVDSGNTAIGAIASRDQDLGGTVQQADRLTASLDQILQGLTPADRASLAESPSTLQSGLKLLAQLNPAIDRLLPALLLAQVNYPSNQNSVASNGSETVAMEWISAFSQRDGGGNALRITPLVDLSNVVKPPVSVPGLQAGTPGAGLGGLNLAPGIPLKDASGTPIPAVAQLLLGLSS
jgi:phospholipid/cholesterol/gamma-HCH transport system substrate-binding protein